MQVTPIAAINGRPVIMVFKGANDVLRILSIAKDISASDATGITAEARLIRGFHHFELKRFSTMYPMLMKK